MFDSALLGERALDPPALSDAEIAVLIAGDPEPPDPGEVEASRRVRVAEVLAAGVSAPMDAVLAGQLAGIDPAGWDDEQRVALAAGLQRVANAAHAQRADAVAAYARAVGPVLGVHPLAAAAGEIGSALALGRGAADALVSTSVSLPDRLPATFALVHRGDL